MKKLSILALVLALGISAINPPDANAAKCSPTGICKACKNCSACKHCSKEGGSCSVCRNKKTAQRSTPAQSRSQRQSARNVSVPAKWSGKCVGVTDGDTITVMYKKTPVRVRLDAVDAPESKQTFGDKSKKGLSSFVFNRIVTVENKGKDRYGRVLGQVFADRVNVNASMVSTGNAWWYRQYAPKRTDLQELEDNAKKAGRGLWWYAKPVAPWEFRKK